MSETAQAQVDRLANFILAEVDGEPSGSQGSVDTAIRLLRERGKYPVVRCGDRSVVLAVEREELAKVMCNSLFDTGRVVLGKEHAAAAVDAILAPLDLREVDITVVLDMRCELPDDRYAGGFVYGEVGEEWALLKPRSAQTGKEDEPCESDTGSSPESSSP